MQKRTFLLMEILIALSLVALCIVPLVRNPFEWTRSEFKKLELLEQERLADWTFTEINEMFLKHEIPWKKIPKLHETAGPFPLPDAKIQLPGRKDKKVSRSFSLRGQGKKDGTSGQEYRQIYVTILINKESYVFRLPFQKLPVAK
ncbi:MAG: hypothetical protein K1X28_04650 [Parachlamydiales bacterium]|nr:hypothetical protein [Parachlamydiales bacterium]